MTNLLELFEVFSADVFAQLATFKSELRSLQEHRCEPGPKGDPGASGADGKTPEVEPIIAAVLQRIPTPKDGERGAPGADGKTPEVEPIIATILQRIPTPKDGERGPKGDTPEIEPIVATVLQRIPSPRDGRDGKDAKGEKGDPGESIKGDKGDAGSSIKIGSGPPLFSARSGDVYIDSQTGDLYQFN